LPLRNCHLYTWGSYIGGQTVTDRTATCNAWSAVRSYVSTSGGAFILPLAGALEPTDLPVRITLRNRQRLTFDWR